MAAVTIYSDFGAQKIKSVTLSIVSPPIRHEVMGPDSVILVFWMLSFYFLLYFTFNIVLVLPYINMNLPWVYTCSQSWTPLPHPSPYNLSGSSQCTRPKHPVSCVEPGLVIRFIYDITHVSMAFSQITPPSPSPTESKRLFYTYVSLLLSCIQCYH